jgi:hypothetical protein
LESIKPDEDLKTLLMGDPLTIADFDPDTCVEALSELVSIAIESRSDDVRLNASEVRQVLLVVSKLFDHLDAWMRAGGKAPSRWIGERAVKA